jgi:casein kinase II subunit alpha
MHRDIKPFNILIDPNQKSLKIIDFGLSDYYLPGK